jgi:hypothetical protein
VLLLSGFGAVSWYRSGSRTFLAFAVTNIVVYALSISSLVVYQGGQTTSMRYLIIALPFFCVLLPDLRAFAYRKTFVALFALSAANMFVIAATSTMYLSENPLSEFAYPDFAKGRLEYSPWLAIAEVSGRTPAFAVGLVYVLALGSLAWYLMKSPRLSTEGAR